MRDVIAEARIGRRRGQGERRRRVRRRAARRSSWPRRGPDAMRIFWDVDAPATLAEMRAQSRSSAAPRDAVARHRLDLWRRTARGRRPIEGFGARALRADLQRARSDDPFPGAAGCSASRPTLPSSATACRTARRASKHSSSTRRRGCRPPFPDRRQWLGRQGDAAERAAHRARLHARAQRLQHAARSPC